MANVPAGQALQPAEPVVHGVGVQLQAACRRAHVEITIGPAVQAAANAPGERVVHGGVAQRTLDAHRGHPLVLVEEAGDCVGIDLRQRDGAALDLELAADLGEGQTLSSNAAHGIGESF